MNKKILKIGGGLALVSAVLSLIYPVETALRTTIGLPLILFFSGYALLSIIHKSWAPITIENILFSVLISISINSSGLAIANMLAHIPLSTTTILIVNCIPLAASLLYIRRKKYEETS